MRKGDLETQRSNQRPLLSSPRRAEPLQGSVPHVRLHAFSILGQLFSPGLCLGLLATFLHMHGLNF